MYDGSRMDSLEFEPRVFPPPPEPVLYQHLLAPVSDGVIVPDAYVVHNGHAVMDVYIIVDEAGSPKLPYLGAPNPHTIEIPVGLASVGKELNNAVSATAIAIGSSMTEKFGEYSEALAALYPQLEPVHPVVDKEPIVPSAEPWPGVEQEQYELPSARDFIVAHMAGFGCVMRRKKKPP